MDNNTWTTEYPSQPGFYWVRNCKLRRWESVAAQPNIVRVYPQLDCFLIGSDWPFEQQDVECAEWCGPIQPPT